MKVKVLQKKIASVTIYIIGMKAVKDKLERYNKLLYEASKHQTKRNETLRHERYEVLRVKKDIYKRPKRLCADKR